MAQNGVMDADKFMELWNDQTKGTVALLKKVGTQWEAAKRRAKRISAKEGVTAWARPKDHKGGKKFANQPATPTPSSAPATAPATENTEGEFTFSIRLPDETLTITGSDFDEAIAASHSELRSRRFTKVKFERNGTPIPYTQIQNGDEVTVANVMYAA